MKNTRLYTHLRFVRGILILIGWSSFLLGCVSEAEKAVTELSQGALYEAIKQVGINYKDELDADPYLQEELKKKLAQLQLSPAQFDELPTWFPVKQNLNVIVIPDLSRRLTQILGQAEDDQELILHIWQCFETAAQKHFSLNQNNTQDKLTISVTPEREDIYKALANSLLVDASKAGQKASSIYVRNKENEFIQSVQRLYEIASNKPVGADYWKFIPSLPNNQLQNTAFERYRNVLIVLTDGYLEAETGPYYTGTATKLWDIRSSVRTSGRSVAEVLQRNNLAIPKGPANAMTNWEVLVLEVKERSSGSGDYAVLKQLWGDWFRGMGATVDEKTFFQMHQNAMANTKDRISAFLNVAPTTVIASTSNSTSEDLSKITSSGSTQYNQLLTEAERAIKANNYDVGKQLLRKARQLQIDQNIPETELAQRLFTEWRDFADATFESLKNTQSDSLLDIPLRWYELAQLLRTIPDTELQQKMALCRR